MGAAAFGSGDASGCAADAAAAVSAAADYDHAQCDGASGGAACQCARVVSADLALPKAHEHFGENGTIAGQHTARLSSVIDALLAGAQPIAA